MAFIFYRTATVQIGYPPAYEHVEGWLLDVIRLRETLYSEAEDSGKPTIWIVSGSNALFGIHSGTIESITGYNVRNYSLHASLHIRLLLSQVRAKVRPGDLVVAPTEWQVRDYTLGTQFDYSSYLQFLAPYVRLSPDSAFDLLSRVPLKRWYDGLVAYLYAPAGIGRLWDRSSIDQLKASWREGRGDAIYSHKALTRSGDINIPAPMTRQTWLEHTEIVVPHGLSDQALQELQRWQSEFREVGAQFISVPPIMLGNKSAQLIDQAFWHRIETMRSQLAAAGVPLHCDPVASVFSSVYRFDTIYHANAEGARLRSLELGQCLAAIIAGEDETTMPIDPEQAVQRVERRLKEQMVDYGSGNMPFQDNLRFLDRARDRIHAYYKAHGKFIPSNGKRELPDEYQIGAAADGPIIYWSDGERYVVLATTTGEDCPVIAANWPDRIYTPGIKDNDLTLCSSYGYSGP